MRLNVPFPRRGLKGWPVAGILAALLLSSAPVKAATATDREPVELRLWNIPSKLATDGVNVARRRVFDEFCRRNPHIRVRALVPLKIEGPAAEGNEFLAVAGGVAPDVFYLYGRKLGDYKQEGFLYPLNAYLANYNRRMGKPYSGVAAPHQVWELCYEQGKILAVPVSYYYMALILDNAALARRGLAGRIPRNWEELYEMARRLTVDPAKEPDGDPRDPIVYGLNVYMGPAAGWYFLQYVWAAGGEVVQAYLPHEGMLKPVPPPPIDFSRLGIRVSDEESYRQKSEAIRESLRAQGLPTDYSPSDLEWRLVTDQSDAMEALYFYRKLWHQPWMRNGDHEFDLTPEMVASRRAVDPVTGETFDLDDPAVRKRIYYGVTIASDAQSGRQLANYTFAMGLGTLAEANAADPNVTTFVPFPSRDGSPPRAFIAGSYLGINAAIQPESRPGRRDVQAIRDAAWSYIEFLTGPEAQQITVATLVEYGLADFVRPALLEEAGYGDILRRIPPERLALWEGLVENARVEPYCRGFTHVMTRELGMALEAAYSDVPHPKTGQFSRDLQAAMSEVCRNVNTMILGRLPDEVVQRRARVGWVVLAIMMGGLVAGAWLVVRLAMRARERFRDTEGFGVGGHPARRRLYAWLLLLPAVGSIAIWNYYPLARGLMMAFQDYRILGGSTYVGLRNFVEAVSEPKFWRYLFQTFQYVVMLVGMGFLAPIFLAVLLTEIPKGKVFFRTLYYLPAVTTGLVTLFLWKGLLYDPSDSGVLNRMIQWMNAWPAWLATLCRVGIGVAALSAAIGFLDLARRDTESRRVRAVAVLLALALLGGLSYLLVETAREAGSFSGLRDALTSPFEFKLQKFLQDPKRALFWLVLPVIWAGAGPGCLIYLAALKGIPEEQYEAADIDGAGLWQKIVHVMVPNLKALIIINFVGAVVGGFQASGNIFVMTGGGPEDATMTIGLYIWYNAFMFLNFGLATAMGWIMGAILIGFTLTQLSILNKLEFRSVAVEQKMKE